MSDHEPTDTTLSDIMHADQTGAEIEATAGRIGMFYERLVSSGMRRKAAEALSAEYASLLLAGTFMDVHERMGAAWIGED